MRIYSFMRAIALLSWNPFFLWSGRTLGASLPTDVEGTGVDDPVVESHQSTFHLQTNEVPSPGLSGNTPLQSTRTLTPREIYDGGYANAAMRLRIASGGAGESGLIAAWAKPFIQYMVEVHHHEPFSIGWYLGDTTESLGFLKDGVVDIAITYNDAAENQSVASGAAVRRIYGFRDHFVLVGPKSNPAGLKPEEDILSMFGKIVTQGNADSFNPPVSTVRPPTRFLSRFDKSATNIKESELFIKIGQVPWSLPYSSWYHQFPRYPQDALEAAALLSEYTLAARSTLLDSPLEIVEKLEVFKAGGDNPDDLLLNPAHVLLGAKANPGDVAIGMAFLDWINDIRGGRKVVKEFKRNGQVVYSEPPF